MPGRSSPTCFRRTREAHLEHERAKTELKGLMPEDAKEAVGHGIRAKRSKSGAISFDLLDVEAAMQRCSETIGAIAAALAKAQAELTNPEKSLTATIPAPLPARGGPDVSLCPFIRQVSRSSVNAWASMRSRSSRRPRSTRRRA